MMDGERKLATIRRIDDIQPIPGADQIVKAVIGGWELVTQKDNYVPGDLCIYFEIDSFLPVREEFEFLRKGCFKSTINLGDGFRIKTIKLRGQISQGLSLPMGDFFDSDINGKWWFREGGGEELIEGTDVTEYFKVQKYEKPLVGPGGSKLGPMNAKGHFPSFIPKTDQERVQNNFRNIQSWVTYASSEVNEITDPVEIDILNMKEGNQHECNGVTYFKSGEMWFERRQIPNEGEVFDERCTFEQTLKLDGSSMTIYHNEGTYGVCSRNWEVKRDDESVYWQVALKSKLFHQLIERNVNVALQGELMGPGVQGNRENLPNHKFFMFDVFDIDKKRYMTPDERMSFIGAMMLNMPLHLDEVHNWEHIPILGRIDFSKFKSPADVLALAERKSLNHAIAEGVVFKSIVEGGPSFKAISNTFLLKEKD